MKHAIVDVATSGRPVAIPDDEDFWAFAFAQTDRERLSFWEALDRWFAHKENFWSHTTTRLLH